jgi:very-short-patch-repair endonuclease
MDALLRHQSGVIAYWQARRSLSRKALEHRLATGRWRRVHRMIYVTIGGPLNPLQKDWVAVLAAGGETGTACLAGLSALCTWGLRGIEAAAIDVLVPHARRVQLPPGVRLRRSRTPDLDATHHISPPATMAPRSLLDAVQWARSDAEARLIIAASFQQGLVTYVDVERAAAVKSRARRRGLLLSTAADCAGGSHSLGELDLMRLCRRYRLPVPSRQSPRRDRLGRQRYLDAVFEPYKLAIEIDGAHHLDVTRMWDDAVRANALELDGYVVLRYPAHAVRSQARRIAAEIREALRNAGWRGGHDAGHTGPGR